MTTAKIRSLVFSIILGIVFLFIFSQAMRTCSHLKQVTVWSRAALLSKHISEYIISNKKRPVDWKEFSKWVYANTEEETEWEIEQLEKRFDILNEGSNETRKNLFIAPKKEAFAEWADQVNSKVSEGLSGWESDQ